MKSLSDIQNSFHSTVNAFTALERKHYEIVGNIKPGREERILWDQIVRIIVLLKRWLLQTGQEFFFGTKDKNHCGTKRIGNKASYPFEYVGNCLDHVMQFDGNSMESCHAGQYLQSIHLDSVKHQLRSLIKQKSFKQTGNSVTYKM